MRLIPALAVACLLTAGCLDDGPPVTARGIEDAPVDAGDGPFTLRVMVTHGPGGEPIAGAGVVVYWPEIELPQIDIDTTGAAQGQGASLNIRFDQPHLEGVLRLRTGADGVAVARVDPGQSVGVVAAADGYTQEWVPGVPTGAADEEARLAVPLFLSQISLHVNGTWAGPGQQGLLGPAWDPQAIVFHPDPATDQGYRDRLAGLQIQVGWSNDLNGVGDLSAAVGATADTLSARADDDMDAGTGDRSETLLLDQSGLADAGLIGAPALHAGPATDSGFLALGGLAYELNVSAQFAGGSQTLLAG